MRRARRSTVDLVGDGMTPLGQPARPFLSNPVAATKGYFNLLNSNFTGKFVIYIAVVNFLIKGLAYKAVTKAALPFLTETLGVGVIQYATYSTVIQLGWSSKPLIAAVSDLAPILGYKKRYYTAVLSILGTLALGSCTFLPLSTDSAVAASGLLFLVVLAVAATDVLTEGKYSEIMQAMTVGRSKIVTWVWFWYTFGGLVAGAVEAPLADASNVILVFWLTAPLFFISALLALLGFIPEGRATYGCCSSCVSQPFAISLTPAELSPTDNGKEKDVGMEMWGHSGPLHLAIRPAISIQIARELTEVAVDPSADAEVKASADDAPALQGASLLSAAPRRRVANESVSSVATAPARRRPNTRNAFRSDSQEMSERHFDASVGAFGPSVPSLVEARDERHPPSHGKAGPGNLDPVDPEPDRRPVDSFGTLAVGIACGLAAIAIAIITLFAPARQYMLIVFFSVSIALLFGMKLAAPPIVFRAAMFGFWKEIFFLHSFSILDFWATAGVACVPDGPHYGLAFYQNYSAILSNGVALLSIAAFPLLLSRRTFRQAVYITTVIKSLSTVFTIVLVKRWNVSIGVSDTVMFVFAVDVVFQFCSMLDFLPLVCLMSRSCARGVETTTFALLAAILNFGETTSSVIAYVWAEGLGISTAMPKQTPATFNGTFNNSTFLFNASNATDFLFNATNSSGYYSGAPSASSPQPLCDFSNLPLLLFLGQVVAPIAIIPLARLCLPDEPIDSASSTSTGEQQPQPR